MHFYNMNISTTILPLTSKITAINPINDYLNRAGCKIYNLRNSRDDQDATTKHYLLYYLKTTFLVV